VIERGDQLNTTDTVDSIALMLSNAKTAINRTIAQERSAIKGLKDSAAVKVKKLLDDFRKTKIV
jgi:hypothetical protein